MKLETFFEKFDQFADARDAVARMRELVLNLAIQGKLVPQDPNDEPAEADYKAVVRARENSILKLTKIDSEATAEDPVLPDSWMGVCLGDLVSIRTGFAFKSGDYSDHGTFILRVTNINPDGSFDTSNSVYLPDDKLDDKMRGFLLEEHELLVVMVGGSLGKIGLVTAQILPALLNQNMWRLKPYSDRLDYRFLKLVLHDLNENRLQITKSTHGHLAMGKYAAAKVPFPPLAEQKRIVAKVDELMALCDRLEAQQQERETQHAALARASLARFTDAPTPDNLHFLFHPSYTISPVDLRKSILALAVKGKLVPQDRNDERAQQQTVGDHVEFQNGYAFKSQWFKPSGMRLCRNVNVSHGVLDWKESEYVDNDIATEFERFALAEGDIVLSLDRPLITSGLKVARVRKVDLPCLLLQRVAKPVPKHDQLDMSYFFLWLNSPEFVDSIDPGRSNGVPHISTRQVQKLPFMLPPLSEQRRIVAKVDQLIALVNSLERQLAVSLATATNLISALIAELTGQPQQLKLSENPGTESMKKKTDRSELHRAMSKPTTLRRFVLRRFAMQSGYRSLDEFDCEYHFEQAESSEAAPICLVGLNGSGKSNLIEAIADVFCFLELINLPWSSVASDSSRYRKNDHRFELEYTIEDAQGERLIRVRKSHKSSVVFVVATEEGEEIVTSPEDRLLLLPRRIIGYSSGLNETVSHPFLRTKTLYSEEVRDAAPPEKAELSQSNPVFDTRTLYMDYESNAAIIISNYIFRKRTDLAVFEDFARVSGVASFGLRFNRKRAGKSGPNSIVRLTSELSNALESFTRCAGVDYDRNQISYSLKFQMDRETVSRFRKEFGSAENLFMAMHKWSLLNALILSDAQRNVYLSSDITKGALERPPSVPPSDRVFNIVDLKLKLSTPAIEIDYSGLSDGEHQFMQVFGTVLLFSEPGTLFLFDEPESHFNPEWRTKFNLILNGLPNASCQEYIISTHSPFVVSGSRMGNVYKFTRTEGTVSCDAVDFETYGASFDVLLKKLFSIDSLIDQSARSELEEIIKRGRIDEMEAAVDDFAESREKRRLYEALIQMEGKNG